MSAIFGIISLDGHPVATETMQRFGRSLAHRAEGAPRLWVSPGAGLGCCHFATTPEAMREVVPYVHPASGVVVAADGRLDEREDLITKLGFTPERGIVLPDSTLLAEAYLKWGEKCPEHLLGDFAFGVWDPRQNRFFAARDHFGVKPFYYVADRRRFAFATELNALLQLPGMSREINHAVVAGYLAEIFDNTDGTAFREVRRLREAHTVMVTPGNVRFSRYYQLEPARTVSARSDEEYAEAFREILFRAVRRRLRSSGPVACMLSGGLDSSAITCVAARIAHEDSSPRIEAFSLVYPTRPECDENRYIQAALRFSGVVWHPVPVNDHRSLEDVRRLVERLQEPNVPLGTFANGSICQQAAASGMRVVLDGHGGDEVVSLGSERLRELFDDRKVWRLSYEYLCLARTSREMNGWRGLLRVLTNIGLAGRIKRRLRRMAASRRAGAPSTLARSEIWPFIEEEMVRKANLIGRNDAVKKAEVAARAAKRWHHYFVNQVAQIGSFERLERLAGTSAVELRYPFWDKDLVEFCQALPSRQKLRRGFTRAVMRKALCKIVPPEITQRRDKTDFLPQATACLLNLKKSACKSLLSIHNARGFEMLNLEWLNATLERSFDSQPIPSFEQQALWRSLALASWLQTLEDI